MISGAIEGLFLILIELFIWLLVEVFFYGTGKIIIYIFKLGRSEFKVIRKSRKDMHGHIFENLYDTPVLIGVLFWIILGFLVSMI